MATHRPTPDELRIFKLIEAMGPMGKIALQQAVGLARAKEKREPVTHEHIVEFLEALVEQSLARAEDEHATEGELGAVLADLRGTARLVRRIFRYAGVPLAKSAG